MLSRTADTETFLAGFSSSPCGARSRRLCRRILRPFRRDATELADLVVTGIKRATASLARDYGDGREPMPKPGDFVMMLDGKGRSRFSWRTTGITIKPLSEVDEAFAWDEGEGDRTRDWWLDAHHRYFGRQASREGFDFDVLTVFERFEIVWPLTGSPTNASAN